VVAVGGEYGTLSEIALALKMGKRVVAISSWEIRRRGVPDERILNAGDAATAVRMATGS
jgi:hypothetical protein